MGNIQGKPPKSKCPAVYSDCQLWAYALEADWNLQWKKAGYYISPQDYPERYTQRYGRPFDPRRPLTDDEVKSYRPTFAPSSQPSKRAADNAWGFALLHPAGDRIGSPADQARRNGSAQGQPVTRFVVLPTFNGSLSSAVKFHLPIPVPVPVTLSASTPVAQLEGRDPNHRHRKMTTSHNIATLTWTATDMTTLTVQPIHTRPKIATFTSDHFIVVKPNGNKHQSPPAGLLARDPKHRHRKMTTPRNIATLTWTASDLTTLTVQSTYTHQTIATFTSNGYVIIKESVATHPSVTQKLEPSVPPGTVVGDIFLPWCTPGVHWLMTCARKGDVGKRGLVMLGVGVWETSARSLMTVAPDGAGDEQGERFGNGYGSDLRRSDMGDAGTIDGEADQQFMVSNGLAETTRAVGGDVMFWSGVVFYVLIFMAIGAFLMRRWRYAADKARWEHKMGKRTYPWVEEAHEWAEEH
ncbi:Cell number regulator 10 [Sphaceloma murrayae]|uniref:Cell number regulator 10 n=1 Tax=Sphaceloma murrayae TaxID=2082308 RepID=A0A2K1R0R5_9PEZI|nr:Cell number regulator 10 [Sphaceloma murrayae]